jgi:uncharacterized SAM-binding protein YcdF (DUF218 family)
VSSINLKSLASSNPSQANQAAEKNPHSSAGLVRRLFWCLIFVCCACCILYAFRGILLTAVARAWVVNDPSAKADAIVILGGKPTLRPAAAARLFHAGAAPRILYMKTRVEQVAGLDLTYSEGEITRRVLLANNVPLQSIVEIGDGVANTRDEALAVRSWVTANHAKSVIIDTDLAHTRRAQWIFERELKGSGAQVFVCAAQPKDYGVTNWWKCEDGLVGFQNEFLKYLFYRVRY